MEKIPNGFPRMRAAVLLGAALLVALAAYSGTPADRQAAPSVPAASIELPPHQDPSLAGLSVSPDADPGADVETF